MHRQTYRRLTNQLRQLEAKKSRSKRTTRAIAKLSHKVIKPIQMYRARVASIASL
jgi:hypothetical protein